MSELEMPGGRAEVYVAQPESGPGPGVLLFSDAIGLRPRIREMADRIASWGYTVLVPNIFYRSGTAAGLGPRTDLRAPGAREEFFASIGPVMNEHTPERAAADLPVYLAALREAAGSTAAGIAVVGYCMGGRLALRAAAQEPETITAVAIFHPGGLVTDAADSPHRVIGRITAEVLARYADNDASMAPPAIETMDQVLTDAGVRFSTEVYPDAVHGFSMSDTPMYNEAAAERHFTELRELLDRTVGGPGCRG